MNVTLITGASGGIGLELSRIFARKGHNLVLVARSEQSLKTLKKELESSYKRNVHLIVRDLSVPDAVQHVFDEIRGLDMTVDVLVNNAGFGDFGFFHESEWLKTEGMLRLNIDALTQLTHLILPGMVERKSGRILNVASTAAFQPGPLMAVYYASKAYVLHFSEALHNELKEFGITVTALCPGPTESGFQKAAAMEDSALFKGRKLPGSREVAEYGYKALMRGQSIAIHGVMNGLMARSVGFMPRAWVMAIVRKLQEKKP